MGPVMIDAPLSSVAICIPAYRAERFISRTIESVLAQSFEAWELVIVDDCSDDDTFAVAQQYASHDARITVHRNATNLGASGNWNRAVGLTSAPFVKLLCSDDVMKPHCLAAEMARFGEPDGESLGLIAGRRDVIAADDSVLRADHGLRGVPKHLRTLERRDLVRAMLRTGTNPLGEPSTVLLRRSALDAVGGFPSEWKYMIDVATYAEIARTHRIGIVRDTVATFRVSPGQWSAVLARDQATEARRFFEQLGREEGFGTIAITRGRALARALQLVRRGATWASARRARRAVPLAPVPADQRSATSTVSL
jgi:hypothetical protein